MLDLRNFVKINIDYVENPELSRTRDTAVLIDMYQDNSKDGYYTSIDSSLNPKAQLALAIFFENGGKRIHYIGAKDKREIADIVKIIKELPNKEIAIAFIHNEENRPDLVKNVQIAMSKEQSELNDGTKEFSGIKEKILVDKKDLCVKETGTIDLEKDILKEDNYVMKHSKSFNDIAGPGAVGFDDDLFPTDMAVLAYLTQVNIESIDTVADYNFTKEGFLDDVLTKKDYLNEILSIDSNSRVRKIIDNSCNCLCELDEGIFRNIGGNTTGGKDLMNHFMKIVLVQTLTDRIMSVLLRKIKYDYNGIEIVSNSIIDELNIYKNNGYLSTNKIWRNEAWTPSGIKVVDKGEILLNGYKFVIAPFSSLSDDERKAHKFPTIYLVISDAYGVRMVEIDGRVY